MGNVVRELKANDRAPDLGPFFVKADHECCNFGIETVTKISKLITGSNQNHKYWKLLMIA